MTNVSQSSIMKQLLFKQKTSGTDSSSISPTHSLSNTSSPTLSLNTKFNSTKNDLGVLIKDLKLACGDLFLIIKQIDLIANCFEEKFMTILMNDEQQRNQQQHHQHVEKLLPETLQQSIYSTQENYKDNSVQQQQRNTKRKPKNMSQQSNCVNKTNSQNENQKQTKSQKLYKMNSTDSNSSSKDSNSIGVFEGDSEHKIINDETKHFQELLWFVENAKKTKATRSKSQPIIRTEQTRRPMSLYEPRPQNENTSNESVQSNQQVTKCSVMESSFYEDKLDDELESFVDTHIQVLNDGNTSSSLSSSSLDVQLSEKRVACSTSTISNQKKNQRHTNSNHHVCFNLNNTIYNTRNDAPIPIEILKETSVISPKQTTESTNDRLIPEYKKTALTSASSNSSTNSERVRLNTKPNNYDSDSVLLSGHNRHSPGHHPHQHHNHSNSMRSETTKTTLL